MMSSFEAMNFVHCLYTCPSCGVTMGYDDMLKNGFTQESLVKYFQFQQHLASLKLTKEELVLIKGLAILTTGYVTFT